MALTLNFPCGKAQLHFILILATVGYRPQEFLPAPRACARAPGRRRRRLPALNEGLPNF